MTAVFWDWLRIAFFSVDGKRDQLIKRSLGPINPVRIGEDFSEDRDGAKLL